jgi:hypothetical protein
LGTKLVTSVQNLLEMNGSVETIFRPRVEADDDAANLPNLLDDIGLGVGAHLQLQSKLRTSEGHS